MTADESAERRRTLHVDDPWSVEWVRVARRVLRPGPGVVGLVPVGANVEVRASARRVAGAVAALAGDRVALIDGWTRWGEDATEEAGEDGVDLLALPSEPDASAAVEALERVIGPARARYKHVIVDLTGLVPEHRQAITIPDAFVLVTAPGRAREEELVAVHRALPDGRDLGVVLIG